LGFSYLIPPVLITPSTTKLRVCVKSSDILRPVAAPAVAVVIFVTTLEADKPPNPTLAGTLTLPPLMLQPAAEVKSIEARLLAMWT
jgi:hypothetical protein